MTSRFPILLVCLSGLLGGVLLPAAFGQDEMTPGEKKILEAVRALQKKVEKLVSRIEALEKALEEKEDARSPSFPPLPGGDPFGGRMTGKFRKIKLPENPTKEQVREYVRKIQDASRGQRVFSSSDPQTTLLIRVGSEHLDVLIDALEREMIGMSNYHLINAIKSLARRKHLPLIRTALPLHKNLAEVILAKGWEREVKDILVEELRSGHSYLPTEWIKAVASLRDPSTYKDLLEFFVHGSNPCMTFDALKAIPDFPRMDLENAVGQVWRRVKSGETGFGPSQWERDTVAKIAAKYGHVDALGHLLNVLNRERDTRFSRYPNLRPEVLRLVPLRGTNRELLQWYTQNRDRLRFDKAKGKYFVQEEKKEDREGEGYL
ncbi:MAG: hypothetical protein ACYTHM_13605 [Planctomycetota bacterium]|jgi:hypothetical protein